MKKYKLYFTSLFLITMLFTACGIKKNYAYDRFGGGISGNKPTLSKEKTIEEQPSSEVKTARKVENKIPDNKMQLSEKQQQKISNIIQSVPEVNVDGKSRNSLRAIKQKITKNQQEKERPKILQQAKRVFWVSASLLLLGAFLTPMDSYVLNNSGPTLLGLGGILLGIAFIMALTGWLNKLKKNTSSGRITFWHVLGGLMGLSILIIVIVLSLSEGGGMFSPF